MTGRIIYNSYSKNNWQHNVPVYIFICGYCGDLETKYLKWIKCSESGAVVHQVLVPGRFYSVNAMFLGAPSCCLWLGDSYRQEPGRVLVPQDLWKHGCYLVVHGWLPRRGRWVLWFRYLFHSYTYGCRYQFHLQFHHQVNQTWRFWWIILQFLLQMSSQSDTLKTDDTVPQKMCA